MQTIENFRLSLTNSIPNFSSRDQAFCKKMLDCLEQETKERYSDGKTVYLLEILGIEISSHGNRQTLRARIAFKSLNKMESHQQQDLERINFTYTFSPKLSVANNIRDLRTYITRRTLALTDNKIEVLIFTTTQSTTTNNLLKQTISATQTITDSLEQQPSRIIAKYTYVIMLLACFPIPIADVIIIFITQFLMLRALSKLYNMRLKTTIKQQITLAIIAASLVFTLISSTKIYFGIGTLAGTITQIVAARYISIKIGKLYCKDLQDIQNNNINTSN